MISGRAEVGDVTFKPPAINMRHSGNWDLYSERLMSTLRQQRTFRAVMGRTSIGSTGNASIAYSHVRSDAGWHR
jgi:hypothetical protein